MANIRYRVLGKRSFRMILIFSFVFVAILPLLILQFVSYNRIGRNLRENMDILASANVTQTKISLETTLNSYHDLLNQIYTSDEIVSLIKNIDSGNNREVSINQMVRTLRGMCYAKDGIESISIITNRGYAVYYDKLTASSMKSSWIDKNNFDRKTILHSGITTNETILLPTGYVLNVGSKPVYLFHLLHRVIDYKNIDAQMGVAILSLNEEVMQNICNRDALQGSFNFVIDAQGQIVSYPEKDQIGQILPRIDYTDSITIGEAWRVIAKDAAGLPGQTAIFDSEMKNGWRVVYVADQSGLYNRITLEQRYLLWVDIFLMLASLSLIWLITAMLSRSMDKVTFAMEQAKKGHLDVSVPEESIFTIEMMTIVRTFNEMMRRINRLIEEVKQATTRKKDAEIKALESQINPHFLYNTLDSINWMAIDKEQYEINRMITSLAKILRYSINNSNAIVPLREEIDWLRQYVSLQQIRYKNNFDFSIEADKQLMEYPVHKLLLQPFVENAIIHGFNNTGRSNLLSVSICGEEDDLLIQISDNGCGIPPATLEELEQPQKDEGNHIGMANAIGRINMYYGEDANVRVLSQQGEGTTVEIRIKRKESGGRV